MSTSQSNAQALRRELIRNQEELLVTSVRQILEGWKTKVGICSTMPENQAGSTMPESAIPNRFPQHSTLKCHAAPWRGTVLHSVSTDAVASIKEKDMGDFVMFVDRYLSDFFVPAKDMMKHVIPIIKDLGLFGKVVLKRASGIDYIIIKGYAGKRSLLTGVRYLSTHPKMLQLAIGKVGLAKSIRGGGAVSVCITIGLEALKFALGEKELTECGISIASDLVKIGIATVVGEIVALAAYGGASAGVIAAGPIILGIVISLAVVAGLDYLDEKYKLTDKVAAIIQNAGEQIAESVNRGVERASGSVYEGLRQFIYHITSGFDVSNPVGTRYF